MIFQYLEVSSVIKRPIIDIVVKSKERFAIYPVLIDSGADYCIFHSELAKSFGIKLSKKTVKFHGVSKKKVVGRFGEVELKIAGHIYKTNVLFAKIIHFEHGILGQLGFFDHFDVKLSHRRQIIEINLVES